MDKHWANTVKAETANTVLTVTGGSVERRGCANGSDNPSKSVRQPERLKMYAELARSQV